MCDFNKNPLRMFVQKNPTSADIISSCRIVWRNGLIATGDQLVRLAAKVQKGQVVLITGATVLIAAAAASVNPIDWKLRSGSAARPQWLAPIGVSPPRHGPKSYASLP